MKINIRTSDSMKQLSERQEDLLNEMRMEISLQKLFSRFFSFFNLKRAKNVETHAANLR